MMLLSSQTVGLVGIGLLGSAIASRLGNSGVAIFGYDHDAEKRESLRTIGSQPVESLNELFDRCSTIILSLPNSDVVKSVVETLLGISNTNEKSLVRTIVDTTTGDPAVMLDCSEQLKKRGISYLEANVAGSSTQLGNGEATLFLGGEHSIVEELNPLLELLSTSRFHIGPVGAASRFKLVHNLVLGLNRAVLAEGLMFAQSLGFELQQTLEILQHTPAASQVMQSKGSKMVNADWSPQARLAQHLKDVHLMLDQARRSGAVTPLTELHAQLLEQCVQYGFGDADNSAILEAFRPDSSECESRLTST